MPAKSTSATRQSFRALVANYWSLALLLVWWLVSRWWLYGYWKRKESQVANDVYYYYNQIGGNDLGHVLIEYPTPIPVFLDLIRSMAPNDHNHFAALFILAMAAFDLITSVFMWHWGYRLGAFYWSIFLALLGPLAWLRIDLLSAVPVAFALLLLTRSPKLSGVMIALGAATKLWPAILIGPAAGFGKTGKRRFFAFFISGLLLGIWSLVFFGWHRSASPLTWQKDRGLQVESVLATVPMWQWSKGDGDLDTDFTKFNAWEIVGRGVSHWITIGDILMALTLIITIIMAWLLAFGGQGLPGWSGIEGTKTSDNVPARSLAICLAQTGLICLIIVSNKTFSPQYLIWLAGPLALLLDQPKQLGMRISRYVIAALALFTCWLTHDIYPVNYAGITDINDKTALVCTELAVRNGLVVVLCLWTLTLAIRQAYLLAHQPTKQRVP